MFLFTLIQVDFQNVLKLSLLSYISDFCWDKVMKTFKRPINCFHGVSRKEQLWICSLNVFLLKQRWMCSYYRKCCFSCLAIACVCAAKRKRESPFSETKRWKHGFPLYQGGVSSFTPSGKSVETLLVSLTSPFQQLPGVNSPVLLRVWSCVQF